jgi:adenylate cyclase
VGSRASPTGAPRRGKSHLYSIFVGAFLLAATLILYANPAVLQSLRFIVFDAYQRVAPAPRLEESPVRIVDIDEESLSRLGQWPWPRSAMARLADALGAHGARAVVFDVMFTEADRTSPEQMLNWLAPDQAAAVRGVISDWPTHDGLFAEALARNPSVLAVTLHGEPEQQDFPLKAGIVFAGDDPAPFLAGFSGFSGNLPALTEAARGLGAINWIPDRDQVVRRVPLLFRQDDSIAPSLVLEALRVAEAESTYVVRSSNAHGAAAFGQGAGVNLVRVGVHAIPTDAHSAIWLHFRRSDPRSYIPAWRVLAGDVESAEIDGKIILIGTSAPGLMDLRATPLDPAIPGVEVHQQALEQILAGRFLTRPDVAPAVELLTAILAVLMLAIAAPRLSAGVGAMLGAATILAIFAASALAFLRLGYLFDPVFASACVFLFEAGSAFYLFQRTEMQRAEIRRAFSQYVAPSVVKQLAANPERLTLGGEVRDLTLLFCDVRNFTGISEGLSAEELTTFINRLLTPLTDIIIESGGTVDKYMGDAIMAFWNAPMDDPDHARHACEAAVRMAAKMVDLNQEWRADAEVAGRPFTEVSIGIGLNSGECCVGNLGSYRRFDYSAIGDNVNITSRLEGLTKAYGLTLIAGENTAQHLPDLPFLEIDLVRVKGHAAPSRIFTLLSTVDGLEGEWEALKSAHDRFLAAYRAAQWDEARRLLADLRSRDVGGLRRLYELYDERIATLAETGAEGWDGVYAFEQKY